MRPSLNNNNNNNNNNIDNHNKAMDVTAAK